MLTTLRRIVLEFTQNSELQSALEHMVVQVKNALNTDCCSVYLANHHQQHFLLMASDGLAKKSLGQTTVSFSEGLIGLVSQREEPINIANASTHQHFIHAPEVEEDDFHAFLGTPIIHQRKVLGVLSIQQKKARNFNENEEAFLVTLSAQLAHALVDAEVKNVFNIEQSTALGVKYIQGIAGAPGIALSDVVVCQPRADLSVVGLQFADDIEHQLNRFSDAIEQTKKDFERLSGNLSTLVSDDSLAIFDVYKQLLTQAGLNQEIIIKINENWSAETALKLVIENYIVQFEAIEDSYFRERASDISDLGNRLLFNLQKQTQQNITLPEKFILLSEDVTASMLAEYQHKGLQAIISFSGSNNSHTAILARALGVPAIMGVSGVPISQMHQQEAIVDGYSGELIINPNKRLKREYKQLIAQENTLQETVKQVAHLPATTLDGKTIKLLLNAGLAAGFEHSKHLGALGVGLYRTEVPFMNRSCFPSEKEQTQIYQKVLSAFPKHSVTMRTLDIGGDKALPYFPIIEDNPFLGWRGIRITLDHPEIFLLQVRAMLRANQVSKNLKIMLPMIASIDELDEALRLINQAYAELSSELSLEPSSEPSSEFANETVVENHEKLVRPQVGMMIEVPSVLFQLKDFAEKVDFFSVGSNDLTQYLLAVDRNNAQVANLYDAYHPAVLRALNIIAKQSAEYSIPLSLCGELASEPAGAILLLAMGYDKLSMNPHNISRIKWVIRHVEFERSKMILAQVLTFSTAKQVHQYLYEQLEQLGLGGFIRAGM